MHLSFIVNLGGNGSLLDFLTDIYRSHLLGEDVLDSEKENIPPAEKVRSLEAGTVTNSVHFDKIGQWPVKSTANRCKMDGYSSRKLFICSKYQVCLCVAKGGETYVLDFHGAK